MLQHSHTIIFSLQLHNFLKNLLVLGGSSKNKEEKKYVGSCAENKIKIIFFKSTRFSFSTFLLFLLMSFSHIKA